MPKMGDAMTQGKILTWRKRPGESIAKGEPIAEIETDKVNVDIEAEDAGRLAEILVGEGQVAAVGAPIARITVPGETLKTPAAPRPAPAAETKVALPRAQAAVATEPKRPAQEAGRVNASPLARRLATEHGIDLQSVHGSGPEGRIIREDVEALLSTAPTATTPRPAPAPISPAGAADQDVPLTRMRQTIAKRMTDSKQHAPHFYVTVPVAMDDALRIRHQLNDTVGESRKVSVNDFLIKATAMTLRKFPNLNSAFLENSIRRFARVNIAIAIALPEGLIAPVLRDCDQKPLVTIATEAAALATRARSGHLHSDDYEGGTFTISNLGMFPDVESFVAIINPPHAAILAVGSARPQAVVRNTQVAVATIMRLTMSADHRVTDGAEVAQFLTELKRLLENPLSLVVQV